MATAKRAKGRVEGRTEVEATTELKTVEMLAVRVRLPPGLTLHAA